MDKSKIFAINLEYDQKILIIFVASKNTSQEAEALGAKFFDYVKNNEVDNVSISGSNSPSIKNKLKFDEFLHGAELKSYNFNIYKSKK